MLAFNEQNGIIRSSGTVNQKFLNTFLCDPKKIVVRSRDATITEGSFTKNNFPKIYRILLF